MKRNPAALRYFAAGEMVELRRVVDSKMASYAIRIGSNAGLPRPGSSLIAVSGDLLGYDFVGGGIDGRIETQRASIDMMLDHLKVHCPQLNGEGMQCPHMRGDPDAVAY